MSHSGELALINWIRQQTEATELISIGPGDDTASLKWQADAECLITTDMLLEGSCFLLEAGAGRIGRKAMAVNLSDIAAMAGRPIAAVVSVGLPRKGGSNLAEELYLGMKERAGAYGTAIVGGDTNTWDGPLAISVTLLGQATGPGPVKRSGAKPGDWVMVSGPLGGSILGKHLDFLPRIPEAIALHQAVDLHAMIDISDGLSRDLHHICTESNCGATLRAESIPISDAAWEMEGEPLQHALSDGEDFELLFTVSPQDGEMLLHDQPIPGITLFHIGECTTNGFWLESSGKREVLIPQGYEHTMEG